MDLQTRAKNILTQPAAEWPVIASESADGASLLRNQAVPAICRWLGTSILGVSLPFVGALVGVSEGFGTSSS
jgi:hypothetical protein